MKNNLVENIVNRYETGHLSRREFVGHLTALVAFLSAAGSTISAQTAANSTFEALELNHLALRVTDLDKTEDFYRRHFGLKTIFNRPGIRFMGFGTNFIAFSSAEKAEMDHFCFTLEKYDQPDIVKKLRENNLKVEVEDERTYTYDPDGLKIQLAHDDHPGSKRPEMTKDLLKKIY